MCNSALGLQMHLRLNYLSDVQSTTKKRDINTYITVPLVRV